MSLNHPSISHRVQEIDRLALLAEAAEGRRAADARRPSAERTTRAAAMQRRLGSVLVTVGRRLQGAEPVGHGGTAMAGSGAAP